MAEEKKEKKKETKKNNKRTFSVNKFIEASAKLSNPNSPYQKAFKVYVGLKKIARMKTMEEWEGVFNNFLKAKI